MQARESDPDALLIEQMCGGRIDRGTWEDYVNQIRAWVTRRYPDLYSHADDIAHESAIRAFLNLESFRGEGSFMHWTYGVAHYIVCRHLRLAHRIPTVSWDSISDEPLVGDGMDERLQVWAIDAALGELTNLERRVFVYRTALDTDHKEIARTLGISSNASRQTWMRAVRKVRSCQGVVVMDGNDAGTA